MCLMRLSSSHLPSSLDTYEGPLSLNSRGRCKTLTWFKPDPRSATCNVSDTSVADMVVHSFQARMTREPEMRKVVGTQWSEPQTDQSTRSPPYDCGRRSSRSAMADLAAVPCRSKPSIARAGYRA